MCHYSLQSFFLLLSNSLLIAWLCLIYCNYFSAAAINSISHGSLMIWCHMTSITSVVNCLGDRAQFSAMILRILLRMQHVLCDNLRILGCIEWAKWPSQSSRFLFCFLVVLSLNSLGRSFWRSLKSTLYRLGLLLHGRDSLNVQVCSETTPNLFVHRSP